MCSELSKLCFTLSFASDTSLASIAFCSASSTFLFISAKSSRFSALLISSSNNFSWVSVRFVFDFKFSIADSLAAFNSSSFGAVVSLGFGVWLSVSVSVFSTNFSDFFVLPLL